MSDGIEKGRITINPRDGMISDSSETGNIILGIDNYQLRFSVSILGRSSICSPTGHSVTGYRDC